MHLEGRSSSIQNPASLPPFVFPFCLFRNWGYVFRVPVSGNFPGLSWLLRSDQQWLSNFIHPSFPLWSMNLCPFRFIRWSWTLNPVLHWAVDLTFSAFAFCVLGREAEALDGKDRGKKSEFLSLLQILGNPVSCFFPERTHISSSLPFITYWVFSCCSFHPWPDIKALAFRTWSLSVQTIPLCSSQAICPSLPSL